MVTSVLCRQYPPLSWLSVSMFNPKMMLNSSSRSSENRSFFTSSMVNGNSDILSKNGSNGSTNTPNTSSTRALQQYHQSPFAIQQLLGLSNSTKRTTSPKDKMYSPTHSAHSSVHTDTSNDALDSKFSNCEQSRASSSISVGSHGTISPISSPKLHSPTLSAPSSLSVSNLVNPNVSTNFSPVAAYFPARHSPLSQTILNHPAISTSASSCFSVNDTSHAANVARISYFNSPAAAAFMSAATMHVGLQQANSISKNNNFVGSNVNSAISMFNPFNSEVGKFADKSSTAGIVLEWIYSFLIWKETFLYAWCH